MSAVFSLDNIVNMKYIAPLSPFHHPLCLVMRCWRMACNLSILGRNRTNEIMSCNFFSSSVHIFGASTLPNLLCFPFLEPKESKYSPFHPTACN